MVKKSNGNGDLRLLSLFSGCGGMDLGFEGDFDVPRQSVNLQRNADWVEEKKSNSVWAHLKKNRFSTVFANDIRPDARAAWLRYFSDKKDKSVYRLDSIVDLVKSAKNGGKSCFVLSNYRGYPKANAVSADGKPHEYLYLLHACAWSPKFRAPLGEIRVEYTDGGQENIPADRNFIVAPNHISYFDPFLAGEATKRFIAFMGKKELFYWKKTIVVIII